MSDKDDAARRLREAGPVFDQIADALATISGQLEEIRTLLARFSEHLGE